MTLSTVYYHATSNHDQAICWCSLWLPLRCPGHSIRAGGSVRARRRFRRLPQSGCGSSVSRSRCLAKLPRAVLSFAHLTLLSRSSCTYSGLRLVRWCRPSLLIFRCRCRLPHSTAPSSSLLLSSPDAPPSLRTASLDVALVVVAIPTLASPLLFMIFIFLACSALHRNCDCPALTRRYSLRPRPDSPSSLPQRCVLCRLLLVVVFIANSPPASGPSPPLGGSRRCSFPALILVLL